MVCLRLGVFPPYLVLATGLILWTEAPMLGSVPRIPKGALAALRSVQRHHCHPMAAARSRSPKPASSGTAAAGRARSRRRGSCAARTRQCRRWRRYAPGRRLASALESRLLLPTREHRALSTILVLTKKGGAVAC